MQQWHQLEFEIKSDMIEQVDDYLFCNQAGSITTIDKSDNISLITILYENKYDIDTISTNLKLELSDIIIGEILYKTIKDQQWEAAWLYDYEPVNIGKNIVVYPDWKELPKNDSNKTYILVDPSIAFGCGNHETTKMCLGWLESNIVKGSSVLDFGCGTGILTITSIKLGANYAEGIDIDPNSIESSIKNATTNMVCDKTIFSDTVSNNKFDLLVANIFSNVLISLVDTMLDRLNDNGKIALSGIIENQVQDVCTVFERYGVVFEPPQQMGQWFLLSGVKIGI
jgi:ribosomal protein L11 methyltransferase